MKTVACCSFHTPARFIPVRDFTSQPETCAWSILRRLTAAHRYSRCCGTTSILRANAESAPLRAFAEDRALALTPCMETCLLKTHRVFTVPLHRRQFALAVLRHYLRRKSPSRNRSINK